MCHLPDRCLRLHWMMQIPYPPAVMSYQQALQKSSKQQTFCPPVSQRGEGEPSAKLKQHMGLGTRRSGSVMDAVKMMLLLFLFFFSLPTLKHIASCTNTKALETVFKTAYRRSDGSIHYKVRHIYDYIHTLILAYMPCLHLYIHTLTLIHLSCTLQVSNTRVPGSFKSPRSKDWTTLTAGELLVWIGITMKMGTLGRARVSHYWNSHDDFHNATISSSMTMNRYVAITGNLSFAARGTDSGWVKIEWLDGVLRTACRAATGITQHVAIDESMIKCLSKYCSWIQHMPKKPIKRGTIDMHVSPEYNPYAHAYAYAYK